MEPSIVCPNCKTEVKLTETLAAPLIEAVRRDADAKMRQKEREIAKREEAIRQQQDAVTQAREAMEAEVTERMKAERKKVAEEEAKKARAAFSLDLHQKAQQLEELTKAFNEREAKLAEAQKAQAGAVRKERELAEARRELDLTVEKRVLEKQAEISKRAEEEAKKARAAFSVELHHKAQQLEELTKAFNEREAKLAEAQKAQAEAVRKERELAEARRELDLTIEKRVAEKQGEILSRAKQEAEQALGLKVQEKEQTILGMQKQIEDLKRRAEQGSQQLQGEVQELQLEALVAREFPARCDSARSQGRVRRRHHSAGRQRPPASHAAKSFGSRSARAIGAMAGCKSCATTSAPPKRMRRSSYRRRCRNPSTFSARSTAFGSPRPNARPRLRWPSGTR